MSQNVAAKINALMQEGEFFSALGVAIAHLKTAGESYDALVQVARIETKLGLLRRAIRSWKRAVHFKADAVAFAGLGSALFRQSRLEAAATALHQSLKLNPNHGPALTYLAMTYGRMGDASRARQFASRALLSEPDNVDALLCKARADLALGEVSAAQAHLSKLASLRHSRQAEVEMLDLEVHLHLQEWEVALFLAADLCEKNPASKPNLARFRKIFQDFRTQVDAARLGAFLSELAIPWAPPAHVPYQISRQATSVIDVILPCHITDVDAKACIAQVVAKTGPRLGKLIVVEYGGSEDGGGRLFDIAKAHGNVTLLQATALADVTASVMLGLDHSSSEAFAVISPTVDVTPGWLDTLYGGLRSDDAAAAVGPLTNEGEWQSYRKVRHEDRNQTHADTPALRANLLKAAAPGGVADLVPLPLLRAFCVLIDRMAFDAVGGFDGAGFTDSEGAMIDLSLRFRASGRNLHAVTDCIVFQRPKIRPAAKDVSEPMEAARTILYQRHSALCYLTSLILCEENAQMNAARNRYAGAADRHVSRLPHFPARSR